MTFAQRSRFARNLLHTVSYNFDVILLSTTISIDPRGVYICPMYPTQKARRKRLIKSSPVTLLLRLLLLLNIRHVRPKLAQVDALLKHLVNFGGSAAGRLGYNEPADGSNDATEAAKEEGRLDAPTGKVAARLQVALDHDGRDERKLSSARERRNDLP